MNIEPFAGEIKMETIKDEEGNDKVVWKYANNKPLIVASYEPMHTLYGSGNTEWARIDKDLNLIHLDMDLCAKGPANSYTALGIGIWNAAIEEAAKTQDDVLTEDGKKVGDIIRGLKK